MKEILCYGDSNTWGYDPDAGTRYGRAVRWTQVMAQALGEGHAVVEEGLNSRTTCWEDGVEGDKNGRRQLLPILMSHAPLDLVILMLGTNDLKTKFGLGAFDIAHGAAAIAEDILKSGAGREDSAPKVLLVSPPPLAETQMWPELFKGGYEKSKEFARLYKQFTEELGIGFFDAGSVVTTSDIDGVHWSAESHKAFGTSIATEVTRMLLR